MTTTETFTNAAGQTFNMEGELVTETGERAATERQVNYLGSLIRRDPGEASNHGLNLNTDLTALSLDRASHLIDCLTS